MTTRRDFLQTGLAASAVLAGLGFGNVTRALAQQALTQDQLLQFDDFGNLTLIHITDCHAHLKPVWFREPDTNIGVGEAAGRVPHVVGEAFQKLFGIAPRSPEAYALTYPDFVDLAKTYGRMGGLDRVATVVKAIRAARVLAFEDLGMVGLAQMQRRLPRADKGRHRLPPELVQIIQATCTSGDEVLFGWRSFEIYPLQVRTAGATPVAVPLRDHTHDLDAMLAAVTDRTRLIFVCNPNNPTSTVVDPAALQAFVAAVPSDILIVIDEAYVEYIRDGMLPDSLGLVRSHPNVVVIRTFSKAYGLAGMRVGYAVADPDIVTALGKVYVPFTASTVAQAAAIACLDAADELLARTDTLVAERARVSSALREAGYELPQSQANFVWLPLPGRTEEFVNAAADNRIVVRPYGQDGVRVTVAAPHENDAFLAFARQWIGAA